MNDLIVMKNGEITLTEEATSTLMAVKEMEIKINTFKEALRLQLLEAMKENFIKSYENDLIKVMYIAPSTRSGINSNNAKKLKKDYPEIYARYETTSNVKEQVRVQIK